MEQGLFLNANIHGMVEAYQSAVETINRCYQELADTDAKVQNAYNLDRPVGTAKWLSSSFTVPTVTYVDDILRHMKSRCWRRIIELSGVRRMMSTKALDALDKKLAASDEGYNKIDLPDITIDSVMAYLVGLQESAKDYAQEAIEEVFDYLRPGMHAGFNKYKSNPAFQVGDRVILNYSTMRHDDDKMNAVDRVFHMLDNKTILYNSYRSPLVEAIERARMADTNGVFETDYFKVRFYGNGNVHLYFKRADLVKQLNQYAGGRNQLRK